MVENGFEGWDIYHHGFWSLRLHLNMQQGQGGPVFPPSRIPASVEISIKLIVCSRARGITWYSHGTRLPRRAADPQLPVDILAPAFDPTTRHDGARVVVPSGDGGCEDVWQEGRGV